MISVQLKDVSKSYNMPGGRQTVLSRICLSIEAGEFVALLGPSGSGKSTLLHLIGGLDRPDEGSVVVGGKDLTQLSESGLARFRNQSIGVIFQFFNLFPSLTVMDNVALPGVLRGLPQDQNRHRALDLLKQVGLERLSQKRANELSGGEMQRVALCRALFLKPPLILADEPTGNLDSKNGNQVMTLFETFARESGATVLMVTHDETLAHRADRLVRMKDGGIAA